METMNKSEKNPETLRLFERRKEITKPRNVRLKFDSSLNKEVWVPRQLDKQGRDEVAEIDLKFIVRNIEKNRSGRVHFDFNEPKPSSSREKPNTPKPKTTEPQPISSTDESEVAKSSSNFPIVELKDYDVAEKTTHDIQINHAIDKLKTKSTETEENLKKPMLIS